MPGETGDDPCPHVSYADLPEVLVPHCSSKVGFGGCLQPFTAQAANLREVGQQVIPIGILLRLRIPNRTTKGVSFRLTFNNVTYLIILDLGYVPHEPANGITPICWKPAHLVA